MNPEELQMLADPRNEDMQSFRRRALSRLAGDPNNPVLAEMAREIQAGKLSVSDALKHSVYGEALSEPQRSFLAWHRGLSAEEKEAQLTSAAYDLTSTVAPPIAPTLRSASASRHREDDYEEDLSERQSWLEW